MSKEMLLKYGCNPNQKPSRIYMADGGELPIEVLNGNPDSCQRYTFAYKSPLCGKAKFIHTYAGAGDPLPSFEGEPKNIELPDLSIDDMTKLIWENLNEENKVSLFVRYIDLETGKFESRIVNKNK